MEDSYIVHRRRKSAAKNREKTPDPYKLLESLIDDDNDDDEEARAKIEKMVEDTEKMEGSIEDSRKNKLFQVKSESEAKVDSSMLDKKKNLKKNSEPSILKTDKDDSKNKTLISERDENITQSVSSALETVKTHDKSDEFSKKKTSSNILVEKKKDLSKDINKQSNQAPTKSKKRHKILTEQRKYSTYSSDDEDENIDKSKKHSSEKEKRKRKSTSKTRGDKDHDSSKNDSLTRKCKKKQSLSSYCESTETDEEVRIEDEEKIFLQKTDSNLKKQIIPLSNESLIEDLVKAEEKYLREINIIDSDIMDPFYMGSQDSGLRKRKSSIIHTESEKKEIVDTISQPSVKKNWFSWLQIFKSKEKKPEGISKDDEILRSLEEKITPKYRELIVDEETEKVTVGRSFISFRNLTSEFKEFVRQNPRQVYIMCKERNRCIAELIVIIIYCGLGAFMFRFTEGAFESFYKCGVKRVKRDFLDSLWNYSHNLREDDWKSMARRKLMEFEEQLHTAHEAGVHTYSGQKSWTFLNAVVYCLTVITTIGENKNIET